MDQDALANPSSSATVYIGLGSNQQNPTQQLHDAIDSISALSQTTLSRTSSFYHSKPLGPQDQPNFVNAVVEIVTSLAPLELLDGLQKIEQHQGRKRKSERWGPRTIDCDILLFGELVMSSERLTLPHYQMHLRDFVLRPLKELVGKSFIIPNQGSIQRLIQQVSALTFEKA